MGGKTKVRAPGAEQSRIAATASSESAPQLAPSQFLSPPEGGYNYQYLAEHGVIDYYLMLGALQADRRRFVDGSLTAAEQAVVDALYLEDPEWTERLLSVAEIEEKINAQRPEEQRLTLADIEQALKYLHLDGMIVRKNSDPLMYILTPRLEINSGDNSLISLLTSEQKAQLITGYGLAGCYQLLGAAQHSYQWSREQTYNGHHRAILDRLYYVLADNGGDPQQPVALDKLLLGADDPEERRRLRAQLQIMHDAELLIQEDLPGNSLGISFKLPSPSPGSLKPVPDSQVAILAAGGPEAVWRQQGLLAAAAQRACRQSAERPLARAIVEQISAHAQQAGLDKLFSPDSLITNNELIANLQREQQITISEQQLQAELGWLRQRQIINTSKIKKAQPAVTLHVYDHPLWVQQREIAELDSEHRGEQEWRLQRYGLAGYYFRRGQVREQQLAIANCSPLNAQRKELMTALAGVFATSALASNPAPLTSAELNRRLAARGISIDQPELDRRLQQLLKRQLITVVDDPSGQPADESYQLVV